MTKTQDETGKLTANEYERIIAEKNGQICAMEKVLKRMLQQLGRPR